MFQDPVGPSSGLSCEIGSFLQCCNPHWFLQPEVMRLYFLVLESWVVRSVLGLELRTPQLSLCVFICMGMWDCQFCQPPCCASSPPQLPVSAPSTHLDECFFFNSLIVRLPYSSTFWQFWLFLFLDWLLSFLWLCEEAKHVYLCLHLGWKSTVI